MSCYATYAATELKDNSMEFSAEIIRTSQRKLVSGDNQYELVLRTENGNIMDLGKLQSDTLFDISITLHNNNNSNSHKEDAGYQQI